jgi:hypothetical protein
LGLRNKYDLRLVLLLLLLLHLILVEVLDLLMELLAVLLVKWFDNLLLRLLIAREQQAFYIEAVLAEKGIHVLLVPLWSVGQYLSEQLLLLLSALAVDDILLELGDLHLVVVDKRRREIDLNKVLKIVERLSIRRQQFIDSIAEVPKELIVPTKLLLGVCRQLDLLDFHGLLVLLIVVLLFEVRDDQFHDWLVGYSVLLLILLNHVIGFQGFLRDLQVWIHSSLVLELGNDLAAVPVVLKTLQVLSLSLLSFYVALQELDPERHSLLHAESFLDLTDYVEGQIFDLDVVKA